MDADHFRMGWRQCSGVIASLEGINRESPQQQ
jgi:hypothetical protein